MITFRKTRGGRWAVFGPASDVTPGATLNVQKRDGSTVEVEIASVGEPFDKGGVSYVYGYKVASKKEEPAPAATVATNETSALREQVAQLQALVAQLLQAGTPYVDPAEIAAAE